MIVIAGCLIVKNDKVLIVKEAKKKCYGQWNFPAGHVDKGELISDAAIREVYEETGCKVKLAGVLPICSVEGDDGEIRLMVRFIADMIEEDIKFDTEEILDVKWIELEQVKNMSEKELRGYDTSIQFIKDYEENRIYPLDIFNDTKYCR